MEYPIYTVAVVTYFSETNLLVAKKMNDSSLTPHQELVTHKDLAEVF